MKTEKTQEEMVNEYQAAVLAAKLCANLLATHDIPGFLKAIERSHAIGPMLDPTLYRAKVKAMEEDKELLEAALKLRKFGQVREDG